MHDELDVSIDSEAKKKKVIEIMENAVKLEVPNKVDCEVGSDWGQIENDDEVEKNYF